MVTANCELVTANCELYMEILFIVVLGLVMGSFLFAMSIRLPKEESVLTRSHCHQCEKPISPLGLIPVIGYLVYRGKCPDCGVKVPLIYPLFEIFNAVLAYSIYLKTGWTPEFLHYFFIFQAFLLIAVIDLRCYLIFQQPVLFALILQAVWLYFFGSKDEILENVIGLTVGVGIFHWISYLYQAIRNKVGLGEGDATLLGLIGFCFGWKILFPVIFWSAALAMIGGGIMLLSKKESLGQKIAFGPWLVLAAFLLWYFPVLRTLPIAF